MNAFKRILNESKIVLTEGAMVERIKSEFDVELDPNINHAGLIYKAPGILETLYKQYINVAQRYELPIMLMTPTRKVNFASVNHTEFAGKNLISDSCDFLVNIRRAYKTFSQNILIGGLMGCKGDAYSGEKILNIDEAYQFHKIQADVFKNTRIDFLFAGIMPEINEAIGMANAMAETNLPYIMSFMVKKNGCLMDGTSISEAIKEIDNKVTFPPNCYMCNCIHPENLKLALTNEKNINRPELKRLKGIQANSSALSPDELNNCNVLQQNNFKSMMHEFVFLKKHLNFSIFGGCCGTDDNFIDEMAYEFKTL